MKYGSVCSGIEAATVAWEPLGWEPQFFAEVDPHCCSLLAAKYPDVPNYGDLTTLLEGLPDDRRSIDLLVGGTPCQSYSVAGDRGGLDDARGNLSLTFVGFFFDYNHGGFSGKMSPVSCQLTEDGRLEPSSGRWWNAGILSPTESSSLNISEHNHTLVPFPSNEGVSSLLDILELTGEHLQEFYLSERACKGIVRRAEKEGRKLPGFLEPVLRKIAGLKPSTESTRATRVRRRKETESRKETNVQDESASQFPPQLWDI